jgi:hypothetical protein
MAGPEQPIHLRLNQVTVYSMQYLVWLRAVQDFKAVTRVDVSATKCLFQTASGKSLLHLEGPDPGEDRVKALVVWNPDQNCYSAIDNLLDNQPPEDKMPASPIGRRDWPRLPGELGSLFPPKPALELLRAELPLTQLLPEHLKIKAIIPPGWGAAVDAIPRAASESNAQAPGKASE